MTKQLRYEISINGPKEIVWSTIISRETYEQWVKAFSPSSTFEGDWKEGAELRFWDPNMGGTQAVLERFQPFDSIVANHTATVTKDGVRETTGEFTEKWIGTREAYELSTQGDQTRLEVIIDTDEAFEKMFNDSWPQALENIKNLVERS